MSERNVKHAADEKRRRPPFRSALRLAGLALAAFAIVFVAPLGARAVWHYQQEGLAASWSRANWSSAGLLPPPEAAPQAIVRIYAARTGRWRGVVAHHSWIVVKGEGERAYARYDKVGWGAPIRENGWAPDGRWFSHEPETIVAIDGPEAQALIPRIRDAAARYPWRERGDYRAWPGPNSNTFVAWVAAQVPELRAALPATALGKDWTPGFAELGATPSGTGLRLSLGGYAGLAVGAAEGLEINLLGLVAGFDPLRLGVKLPGWGDLRLLDALPLQAPGRADASGSRAAAPTEDAAMRLAHDGVVR